MRNIRRCLALALICAGASAAHADYDAGKAAWNAGEFDTARTEWTNAAIAGNADAQYELGMMLANGAGVPRDVIAAYAWFAIAQDNGIPDARDKAELLLRDYIPRHCHYDALKLVREFQNGRPERLARGNRQRSRCWRVPQR